MQPVVLPGFLEKLGPTINHHGLVAVGAFVLLEDFGVPLPGETTLIAAAIYAGAGQLNIVTLAIVAFAAAVLGDNIGYLIGCLGGRPLVERYGRYILLKPERFAKAEAYFERQGPKIIVIARFIEGLRQANGIVAGTSGMRWSRFLLFNAIGAALWVALWTTVGALAGPHIGTIYDDVTRYFLIVVGALVLALIAYLLRRRQKRKVAALMASTEVSVSVVIEEDAPPSDPLD